MKNTARIDVGPESTSSKELGLLLPWVVQASMQFTQHATPKTSVMSNMHNYTQYAYQFEWDVGPLNIEPPHHMPWGDWSRFAMSGNQAKLTNEARDWSPISRRPDNKAGMNASA